jgi:HSP20 family protein
MAQETHGGAAGHTPEAGQGDIQQHRDTRNQGGTATQQSGHSEKLQGSPSGQGQDVQVGRNSEGGGIEQRRSQGLARYSRDPFAMMQRLSDEMDELFNTFFYGHAPARSSRQSQLQSLWTPEIEFSEQGNELRVTVDLPGVPKENVKVDIQQGVLTIQGERREERSEGGEQQGFRRSERRYGGFYRSIPLPEGVNAEQAQAQLKEGVLEIRLPLAEQKQARRLEIQG